jgi:hypothetical protein
VLARLEHAHGEVGVRRDGRGEDDRVERVVGQQVIELAGEAGAAVQRLVAGADLLAPVAQPGELAAGQRVEVAREVRAPVAEADDADPPRRITFSAAAPRVTPRRSSTTGAPVATCAWSIPGCAVTITTRSAPATASSSEPAGAQAPRSAAAASVPSSASQPRTS